MDEREDFIRRLLAKEASMAALCASFGISRRTGYKWESRFFEGGIPNLVDRSRAPKTPGHALDAELERRIVELRQRYPFWGPKKLRAWLMSHAPESPWPAASTIGDVLQRRGLIEERRRRRRTPLCTQPFASCTAPNVVWCADFKGCFRVAGRYCHPLTITDGFSRYFLRCEGMEAERFEPVKRAFDATFREFGLPLRIRTDNGSPFASSAVGGLSRLSVWWVKLGITPERIEPGKPQQNGRHERMHRTLKQQVTKPVKSSHAEQQQAFDSFKKHYNDERPHEALGQITPATVYVTSSRSMPIEPNDPEYPDDFELRRVAKAGCFRWNGTQTVLSNVLAQEVIGLEPIDDARWQIWFGPIYLGTLREDRIGKNTLLKNKGPGKLERTRGRSG